MREILFYGFVGNFSVEQFILQLTAIASTNEGAFMKINSAGGAVDAGWGVVSEWRAFKGAKKIIVHGAAHSMMAVILLFTEDTTAIEQSKFILHRASTFFENENTTEKKSVDETNKDIRKAFEDRLDIAAFEEIGREQHGVTFSLGRFFNSSEPVIDVHLNSSQAKAIGLIKNVVSLNAKEAEDINQNLLTANAVHGVQMLKIEDIDKKTEIAMTPEEIKKKYPEAFKKIQADAKPAPVAEIPALTSPSSPVTAAQPTDVQAAVAAERKRIESWDTWREYDEKAVTAGISSGLEIDASQQQKFILAAAKKASTVKAEGDSPGDVNTPAVNPDANADEQKPEVKAFMGEVYAEMGMKKPSEN